MGYKCVQNLYVHWMSSLENERKATFYVTECVLDNPGKLLTICSNSSQCQICNSVFREASSPWPIHHWIATWITHLLCSQHRRIQDLFPEWDRFNIGRTPSRMTQSQPTSLLLVSYASFSRYDTPGTYIIMSETSLLAQMAPLPSSQC